MSYQALKYIYILEYTLGGRAGPAFPWMSLTVVLLLSASYRHVERPIMLSSLDMHEMQAMGWAFVTGDFWLQACVDYDGVRSTWNKLSLRHGQKGNQATMYLHGVSRSSNADFMMHQY